MTTTTLMSTASRAADGVRDFLHSRGIDLPDGDDDDPPDAKTVNGVGNRKNALLLKAIHNDGVKCSRMRASILKPRAMRD